MQYYEMTFLKLLIGFIILIIHLNLSGKTQLSQMTPIDFIGNFILGGIIGGVIYSDTIPLQQYLIILLMGVFLISVLNYISKHVTFVRTFAIGDPLPIIRNGEFIMDNILKKRNKVDILIITSQLHAQGINSFNEVKYAQIEPDGQLSVITKDRYMFSVILVKQGNIRNQGLEMIEKEQQWLEDKINQHNIDLKDIFLAEFWDGKITFRMQDGRLID